MFSQALGNHFSPTVATLAKLFSGGELRRQRYDIKDFTDYSYQTVRTIALCTLK